MQPLLEKLVYSTETSFSFSVHKGKQLDYPWHFHPEFQLNFVVHGKGQRLIGDHLENFMSGDLILIGDGLPHFWQYEDVYFNAEDSGEAIVIHFSNDFLGIDFFEKPEFRSIKKMLMLCSRGLKCTANTEEFSNAFKKMIQSNSFERILILLGILNDLAHSKEYTAISNAGFVNRFDDFEMDKINKIYKFLFQNYRQDINLKQISQMANMTPTSFSRYFKKKTTKSYMEVLIELRLGYACRLLQESDSTVLQVCYECGFNNMANFSQHFKEHFKESPLEYRKKFRS